MMTIFRVFAEIVSFDWGADHLILDIVLPEGCTLWDLKKWLHGLFARDYVFKGPRRDGGLVLLEAREVVTLHEVFHLQGLAFRGALFELVLQHHLQSVGALDLVVAPFIVHNALVASQAFLQGCLLGSHTWQRRSPRRLIDVLLHDRLQTTKGRNNARSLVK